MKRHALRFDLCSLLFAVICGALPAPGQILPTAGVYDATNIVKFVAEGSSLDLPQFKQDVARAFNSDFGGVNQCEAIGGNAGPYDFAFGAGQAKVLNLTGGLRNDVGITSGVVSEVSGISGIGVWESSKPEVIFIMNGISNGVPAEAVVEFGLTVLSTSFASTGEVTATAQFSDGTAASARRTIGKVTAADDTFFGFRAPSGQAIESVTITNDVRRPIFMEDMGFITAARPYRSHVMK